MLNLRLREIAVGLFFALVHLGFYQQLTQSTISKNSKSLPILLEILPPKPKPKPQPPPVPKPEPKKLEPKPAEPPKPLKPVPPKPKPIKPPKPKKVVVKPPKQSAEKPEFKRVVEKPKLQQESLIKVQAEEVVEKEIAAHPQQLSEPEVKKPDDKPHEKVPETSPEPKPEPKPEPEPVHEPVITKVTGIGSCSSTLNNYPAEAREQGLEGTVKIKVQVLADGSIGNASVVQSSGHDILDQSVLANVHDCSLEPAEKDGVPIKSSVIIPVRFRLEN